MKNLKNKRAVENFKNKLKKGVATIGIGVTIGAGGVTAVNGGFEINANEENSNSITLTSNELKGEVKDLIENYEMSEEDYKEMYKIAKNFEHGDVKLSTNVANKNGSVDDEVLMTYEKLLDELTGLVIKRSDMISEDPNVDTTIIDEKIDECVNKLEVFGMNENYTDCVKEAYKIRKDAKIKKKSGIKNVARTIYYLVNKYKISISEAETVLKIYTILTNNSINVSIDDVALDVENYELIAEACGNQYKVGIDPETVDYVLVEKPTNDAEQDSAIDGPENER